MWLFAIIYIVSYLQLFCAPDEAEKAIDRGQHRVDAGLFFKKTCKVSFVIVILQCNRVAASAKGYNEISQEYELKSLQQPLQLQGLSFLYSYA